MEELENIENIIPEEDKLEVNIIKESICLNTIQDFMERKESESLDSTKTENTARLSM